MNSNICRREMAWVVSRISYKLVPKATVVQRIGEQLEEVFSRRILSIWETNRASFPIKVKGEIRTSMQFEEEIADRLLNSEVDRVLWEDRRA